MAQAEVITRLDSPVSPQRRGDIQGLRAVAVLLVVLYHADLGFSGGFVGVDVFFVISGFVITRMLLAEIERDDRISLGRFYLRRIRRLLPALGLMLTVVMLASGLLAPLGGQEVTARTGAAAAVFNANTYLIRFGGDGYFEVDASVNALLHTWSLSVEEQFYLVFPAMLLGGWVIGRRVRGLGRRHSLTIVLIVITGLSSVLLWAVTAGRTPLGDLADQFAFYSSLTRAWEFALGGLLAVVSIRLRDISRGMSLAFALTGVLLVGYAGLRFDDLTPFPGAATLVPVVGAVCLLAAGEARVTNPVSRSLERRPAQAVGDLSYSWYLWHWPFIVFAAALWPTTSRAVTVAAVVSLIPAWLSYRFVEGPIRFARNTGQRRTLFLALACIMLPMAAAVALSAMHRAVVETDAISELRYDLRQHSECGPARPLGDQVQPECAAGSTDRPTADVVLIGDSNARHFGEGFVGAADDVGIASTVSWLNNCPFADLETLTDGNSNERCTSFVNDSIDSLVDERPSLVAIASSSDTYVQSSEFQFRDPMTSVIGRSPEEKSVLWEAGLSRVVDRLSSEGIRVVIVHPVPKFVGWDPRECAVIGLLRDADFCSRVQDRASVDLFREPAVLAESEVAATTGATTLDVADLLCPDELCATYRDGIWVWRDGTHISVDKSVELTPVFVGLFVGEGLS